MMRPLLNINHLTKTYGKTKACDRITFDLYPGQVLGIIGESGSGKSTLLNSIGSNLSIDSGKVTYTNSNNEILNIKQLPESKRSLYMVIMVSMRERFGSSMIIAG